MLTPGANPVQETSQDYDATEARTMVLDPLSRLVSALDTNDYFQYGDKGMDHNFGHARVVLLRPMISMTIRDFRHGFMRSVCLAHKSKGFLPVGDANAKSTTVIGDLTICGYAVTVDKSMRPRYMKPYLEALNAMYQFETIPDLLMTSLDGYITARRTGISAGVAEAGHRHSKPTLRTTSFLRVSI
jgi:hypothetical protein